MKIPIVIVRKDPNPEEMKSLNPNDTSAACPSKKGSEEIGNFNDLAAGLKLRLKETNIESEKCANIKTPANLKSCLKSDTKKKIPISIKIPIKHESSPIPLQEAANKPGSVDCQFNCQSYGSVNCVATQTDQSKTGCSLM